MALGSVEVGEVVERGDRLDRRDLVSKAMASSPTAAMCAPSVGIAALTAAVLWSAVEDLRRHGELGAVLAAGRAELVAPALVALVVLVAVAERFWPAEPHRVLSSGHIQDGCYLVLHGAVVVPVMTLLSVGWAHLIAANAGFLELRGTQRWPSWVLLPVAIVAMDGANWLAHYGDHRIGTLWRFHRLHHSQEELSVLTSFRAHPLMHTTGFLLASVPVVVLMGSRPIVPALITAYVCIGTLQHANVRWSFGPLGRVLVSPAYHRLHHDPAAPRANLGVVLVLWDVLAGYANFPSPATACGPTGLAGRPLAVEQATSRLRPLRLMASQLLEPFSR
jgi:sterol desaturase/sphingolipid hydroxylase (fatty acid hydroxylase superfamily)